MRALHVARSALLLLCFACGRRTHEGPSPLALPRPTPAVVTAVRDDSIGVAALEQRVETAAARRDAVFLDSVWAPTFRFTHAGGTVQSRAELLSAFRQSRPVNGPRTLAREVDSQSVEMHQNIAVTSGIIHVRRCTGAIYHGYTVRFIRVYKRRDTGHWQLLSHHTGRGGRSRAYRVGGGNLT